GAHPDGASRPLRRFAAPGRLVQLASADLDRRIRGWPLQGGADPGRHGSFERRPIDVHTGGPHHLALGVERLGLHPEQPAALIGLREVREEPEQARGPADPEDQEPGGHGVERSGMPDLPGVEGPPSRVDHVVGRDAFRLVHQQEPFDRAHGSTGSPRSAASSRSTVPARPCFDVYPDASRWPPPPKIDATFDTSWPPRERRLTRNLPSRCCFITAATSVSRAVRTTSGRSPPMARTSLKTISHVDEADGSMRGVVPSPSLLTW